jgi:PAS domain S-box-containing protein
MGLLFAILMGGIFLALFKASRTLLEREQAQEELRAYKEHLEEMVAARTAELEAANTRYRKQVVETLQAQEALRESEERFRKLGESAKDAIIIMDVDGRISFWNKAAQGMFKYRPDEVLGQDLHQLLAPERYREQFQMCFREFKAAGEDRPLAKTMELWALRSDGKEFPVELSLSRMKVKGQWETIGIVRDISERKRAEEERNKLQEQLWRSQKMEALGTLAGGIAHDFNNILAAIIGYAELAMIDVPESSVQHSYLKSVVKAGYRAKDLVQQILSFTRQDHPEKRLITMVPLVKEILKLLRASLPKNIEISLSVQEGSSTVLADATQMHQVLMNLCTNAAHAMQEKGGKLHIQLSRVVIRDGGSIPGVSLSAGPYLQLRVQDTGHGMTPEVMERIFDPYFTTKKRGEGTGLGLSVVQGIVQGHGGAIRVQSQVGVGSTFDIFLPLVEDTPELRDTWEFDSLPKGKETILLVDDEETVLDVSRRMLERLGYCVEPRTDAEEALEMFRAEPGRFSLVISDLIMPTMTGDQLIGEIRRIRPDIPVILISGGAARMRVSTGNPEKADAILRKPLVMKELAEAVHRLLSQSGTRSAPTS